MDKYRQHGQPPNIEEITRPAPNMDNVDNMDNARRVEKRRPRRAVLLPCLPFRAASRPKPESLNTAPNMDKYRQHEQPPYIEQVTSPRPIWTTWTTEHRHTAPPCREEEAAPCCSFAAFALSFSISHAPPFRAAEDEPRKPQPRPPLMNSTAPDIDNVDNMDNTDNHPQR